MSNSRTSSDNNNAISELAEKAGEAREKMSRHRDTIYAAELSRLSVSIPGGFTPLFRRLETIVPI